MQRKADSQRHKEDTRRIYKEDIQGGHKEDTRRIYKEDIQGGHSRKEERHRVDTVWVGRVDQMDAK